LFELTISFEFLRENGEGTEEVINIELLILVVLGIVNELLLLFILLKRSSFKIIFLIVNLVKINIRI